MQCSRRPSHPARCRRTRQGTDPHIVLALRLLHRPHAGHMQSEHEREQASDRMRPLLCRWLATCASSGVYLLQHLPLSFCFWRCLKPKGATVQSHCNARPGISIAGSYVMLILLADAVAVASGRRLGMRPGQCRPVQCMAPQTRQRSLSVCIHSALRHEGAVHMHAVQPCGGQLAGRLPTPLAGQARG